MKKEIHINDILRVFELTIADIDLDLRRTTYRAACRKVTLFKNTIRKKRRELARKHHPDHGGDIARMQEINAMYDIVKTLKVIRPQPVQQTTVYYYYGGYGPSSATTAGSTTSTAYTTYY